MTKLEYFQWLREMDGSFCMSVYEKAHMAQEVTDDEEMSELAKTCVVSTDDLDFYVEAEYQKLEKKEFDDDISGHCHYPV